MGRRRRRNRHPKRYCTIDYLECTHLNKVGQGIVEWHGKETRVNQLLPGEKARILVFFEDNDYVEAKAIDIIDVSPSRKLELNHPKMQLGSYTLAHLTDDAHDKFKQDRVEELFNMQALPIKVGKRTYYRNKVSLSDGGFMPPGRRRRHSIIPEIFDLMEIDFDKYKDTEGATIIRRLDTEIVGRPGTQLYTTDTMLGKKFRINLNSFYQVNSEMAELAYQEIKDNIKRDDVVYDLFGGAATIGIVISDVAKKVFSVEINNDSHKDALENIKINDSKNVEAICGDANAWVQNTKDKADTIVIDPARAGISEQSCSVINNSGAKKIIYLSCNIDTQARDIKLMDKYKIIHIQPYDFFPQTYHIENLVILEKVA